MTTSLRSAYTVLSESTSDLVPFYMMTAAAGAAARVLPVGGLVAAYLLLTSQGRIDEFESSVEGFETSSLMSSNGELNQTAADSLNESFSSLVTPEVTALVGLSLVAGIVVFGVANAFVSAAKINAAYSSLSTSSSSSLPSPSPSSRSSVTEGLRGGVSDFTPFLVLFGIEALIEILLLTALVGSTAVLPAVAVALLVPVWLVSALGVHLLFVFTPQAVVVDSVGVFGALRKNLEFVRDQPVETFIYLIVAVVVYFVAFGVSAVLSLVSATTVASLIVMLGVAPFLDITKTSLYSEKFRESGSRSGSGSGSGSEETAYSIRRSQSTRLLDAVKTGLSETVLFVRSHPLLVAVSLVVFGVGLVQGIDAVSGIEIAIESPEESSPIFQNPAGSFFEISANNWLVGFSQTFSGLAFGVPTLVGIWYNGIIIGGVVGVRLGATDPMSLMSLAFLLVPHGIIEIPAFGVTGGLGLHLGRVVWRWARKKTTAEEVADEVRKAYSILVGLLVVFVVASAVESFVTPVIYSVVS